MDRIVLSDQQRQAVTTVVDWFQNRTAQQQVARIWGFAGCGKSTITRYIIEELGLDAMTRAPDGTCPTTGGVLYAAFTGKAALVMTRKGTPASTIHSLIYRVSEATQGSASYWSHVTPSMPAAARRCNW